MLMAEGPTAMDDEEAPSKDVSGKGSNQMSSFGKDTLSPSMDVESPPTTFLPGFLSPSGNVAKTTSLPPPPGPSGPPPKHIMERHRMSQEKSLLSSSRRVEEEDEEILEEEEEDEEDEVVEVIDLTKNKITENKTKPYWSQRRRVETHSKAIQLMKENSVDGVDMQEAFCIKNGSFWCIYCAKTVSHRDKDRIVMHLKTRAE